MQNKMNIDELLRDGLLPEFEPGDELNGKVIAKIAAGNCSAPVTPIKKAKASSLTKIIAAACAVVIAGAVGTYAASVFITKPEVIDHGIYVGNPSYVNEKALATSNNNEKPAAGYKTKTTEYDTYEEAYKAVGFGVMLDGKYELIGKVETSVTNGSDIKYVSISAEYSYGNGTFLTSFSKMTGNVASDAAHVIQLANTSNKREYKTKGGTEFTLVDEKRNDETRTFVMIACDDFSGYIMFENLTDAQIHKILDSVILK